MSDKKILVFSEILCILNIVEGVILLAIAGVVEMQVWARVALIVVAVTVFAVNIAYACVLDKNMGKFECRNCGHKFTPTMKAYIIGPHSITTRLLRCPECGKSTWCRHRFK